IYANADLTIASRDVPHDRIVEECIEALHSRLCGGQQAQPPADIASASR
ncbi:shikimate kinase, partial [Herbaspirillum sp. HC18]